MRHKESGHRDWKSSKKGHRDKDKDDHGNQISAGQEPQSLSIKVEKDGADFDGEMPWETRITTFDCKGNKEAIFTIFEDGRLRFEQYNSDGERYIIHLDNTENGEGFDWNKIITLRNADDDRTYQKMVFDDTDLRLYQFQDNNITQRLDIDQDGSDPWLAREFVFDDQGNKIDTRYYYEIQEIPAAYDLDGFGLA
jgi:hypothetical protein